MASVARLFVMPSSDPKKRLDDIVGGVFDPTGVGNVGVEGRFEVSMERGAGESWAMMKTR